MSLGDGIYNIIDVGVVEYFIFSSQNYVTSAVKNYQDDLDNNNDILPSK